MSELPAARDALCERFCAAPAKHFFARPAADEWSAADNITHLIQATLPLVRALRDPARLPQAEAAPPARDIRAAYQAALAGGLAVPAAFAPPPAIATDAPARDALLERFHKAMTGLAAAVAPWAGHDLDTRMLPHPALGPVSARAMIDFTVFHTGLHLEQATRAFGDAAVADWCTPEGRDGAARGLADAAPGAHAVDDERIVSYSWGPADAPAVVLAHGWGLSASRMTPLVAPLRAAGWRVVALDAPAHGQSTGLTLNMPLYARAIKAVLCDSGAVAVIGHSFGGTAALWLASHQPPPALRAVVTLGAGSGADYLSEHTLSQLPAALRAAWVDAFTRRFGGAPADYSIERFGPRVTLPVLNIHDLNDRTVGMAQAGRIRRVLPNARACDTQGYGHIAIVRSPEAHAALLSHIGPI